MKIAITGAAGKIGSNIAFRIAAGELFGPSRSVELRLLEVPEALGTLKGHIMELEDSAFPLLRGIVATSDPDEAFDDVDVALLIGASPRTKGMQRSDLLGANASIFRAQGASLDRKAKRSVKVVVVGNPANTNTFIASRFAPGIPATQFTALMRLDHNRAVSQLALRTGAAVGDVEGVVVWGNHSITQYPDLRFATVHGTPAYETVADDEWIRTAFIDKVANRGGEILETRPYSAVHGAVTATIDHMRDWIFGSGGKWRSMGVVSRGDYGVPEGLVFGLPVVCEDGGWRVVPDLAMDAFSRARISASIAELQDERDRLAELL